MLDFSTYQDRARATAIYPADHAVVYPALGLAGEAGEVVEKVKKALRDAGGVIDDERRAQIVAEVGDVLWYLANLLADLDVDLEEAAAANLAKLASRSERDVLHGDGDDR